MHSFETGITWILMRSFGTQNGYFHVPEARDMLSVELYDDI